MLRPPDVLRFVPMLGTVLLTSCGHIGIDLDSENGSGDGSGAASIMAVGGGPGNGGAPGGGTGSGGETGGGAGPAGGGARPTGGGENGSGGAASGGAPASGGSGSGSAPSSGGSDSSCEGGTEPDFSLVGWAAEAGGTTGGKGGDTVTVWAGGQLLNELASKNPLTPLTILVANTITQANTGDNKVDIANVEDVSIIGLGDQGVFAGIGLRIVNSSNIVVRNLHIHHVALGEGDAIGLAGPADHIWIDHCEFDAEFEGALEGTYDGLIDAKANVSHVTYSWNYIHDSWNPLLVGSTETDTSDRKLTMHHNRVENCDSGTPSFRAGNGHVFNNLYSDIATLAINSRLGACLRIENNVFSNVTNPWLSAYSATLGGAELICNELDSSSSFDYSTPDFSPIEECQATVPYDYSGVLTETGSVAAMVMEHAGYAKLADPEAY